MFTRQWSHRYPQSSVGRPTFVAEFDVWDEQQAAAAEQIEACLDKVDLVRLVFCDPHGLARSKTLTAGAFRRVLHNGMDFSPGPFIFDTGHAIAVDFLANDPGVGTGEICGAGDFVVVPDPLTFHLLPGSEPRTAWVIGDEFLRDGCPHPLSTRRVLRKICTQYAGYRLAPIVGLEVEWYLTRRLGGPPGYVGNGFGEQGTAPEVEPLNAGYQFNLDTYTNSLTEIMDPLSMTLLDLGLPLRTVEHESGPGQVEVTFDPMLALDAADAMLLFRTIIKQTCARRGFHASFMALPGIASFDPSGWHLHQSVLSTTTDRNVFTVDNTEGMSAEGKAYVEGLLALAREFCLLSVPTVNGYWRLRSEFTLSPTRIGWSYEDRTAMVRVLGVGSSTHVENRVGEPCANPYLSIAAQLYAGLDGMTALTGGARPDGLEPVPDTDVHSGEERPADVLPQSLSEALDVFRRSGHARTLLGGPLASCLVKLKESEAARYEAWCDKNQPPAGQVTEWEHREYFEVY